MLVWIEELKQRAEYGHLLRVREIARLLGVSRQQIYKMMKAGKIPGVYRLSIRGIRVCAATLFEWSKQTLVTNETFGDKSEAIDRSTATDTDFNEVGSESNYRAFK